MGESMTIEIKMIPAVLLYALYVAGMIMVAISPAFPEFNWLITAGIALLLGFIAYLRYDFTALISVKERSISLTLVDIAWGAFVVCMSAVAGFYAAQAFAGN